MGRFIRKLLRLRRPTPKPPPALMPLPTPSPVTSLFRDTFRDTSRWEFETGDSFTGAQVYTGLNYTIDREGLNLVATPDRQSVRMLSREAPFTKGTRLTFAASLGPASKALIPALWAIGESIDWPRCGEVDVMECGLGGRWEVKQTTHTAHTHARFGDYGLGANPEPAPEGLSLYSAEWREEGIRFSVNGVYSHPDPIPFAANEPMRLVMNVAMRPGFSLDEEWRMTVKEVAVDPL